ncbi:MAG: rhodanese-like domain-containing protein [Candidatus Paceibacterota bacterium]
MFFNSVPTVSVDDAYQGKDKPNTAFIDVRTSAEYAAGHAVGARNVPLDTLSDAHAAELAPHDAVYVICQSGGRSAAAAGLLTKAGVKAVNVSGGTLAWRSAGLPME